MKIPLVLHPFRAALLGLVVCLCPVTSQAQAAENLVKNGDFAKDTEDWILRVPQKPGVTALLSRNNTGAAYVSILKGGESKSSVVLQQSLTATLVKDGVYRVAFDAGSDELKTIDVIFRSTDNSILGGTYNLSVGPSTSHHTFLYTHTRADATGVKLSFRLGGNDISVTFDNITVVRQTPATGDQPPAETTPSAAPSPNTASQ
jgi:hypothetical protein